MNKILLKNANIATSARVFQGDILIEGEVITQVGGQIQTGPGIENIDAGGRFVLPGGVDAHTHFDLDVGIAVASDSFYTGSIAAACGGTTTIIDHMGFGPAGCRLTHQPEVYRKLAEDAVIDYGLHGVMQHVDSQVISDMELLKQQGITSLKVYLTYGYMLHDPDVLKILQRAKELDMVVCVHCENDSIIASLKEHYLSNGCTQTKYHPLSRPPEAEAEAVFRMLMLARAAGNAKMYIVHLSSALGLDAIRTARAYGQHNIFAETCPQYLMLDQSRYDDPVEGLKYMISPPLREPENLSRLWHGLSGDSIDTVATDHCPFFFATQKQAGKDNFSLTPGGAPGVELRMSIMFSEGYVKGRMTLPQMVKACCTRPAEIFGIAPQKGDIRPGADADLVIFDPDIKWTATKSLLHENVDYTPYEGLELTGKPVLTISRGKVVAKDGEFTGHKGYGRYLHRTTES